MNETARKPVDRFWHLLANPWKRNAMAKADPKTGFTIALPGGALPVTVRRHPQARRVSIRMEPRGNGAILTLPQWMPLRDGMNFVERHRDWLAETAAGRPAPVPFTPGAFIPFQDTELVIDHDANRRGHARIDGNRLRVGGDEPHLARRVRDALKKEARRTFRTLVTTKAGLIGKRPGRISIRDQTSRWGSCSSNGDLNFNWRLICAPAFVTDYVAAHEVAHLVYMDHSAAFWRQVAALTDHPETGRTWLRENGAGLHRIGSDDTVAV